MVPTIRIRQVMKRGHHLVYILTNWPKKQEEYNLSKGNRLWSMEQVHSFWRTTSQIHGINWPKKALFLSVNVFSTKVFGGYYFYVSYWRWDHQFMWSSEPHKGLAGCRAKAVPSFLSFSKTLTVGLAPWIVPMTSYSAVKPSTNWTYPAAVQNKF